MWTCSPWSRARNAASCSAASSLFARRLRFRLRVAGRLDLHRVGAEHPGRVDLHRVGVDEQRHVDVAFLEPLHDPRDRRLVGDHVQAAFGGQLLPRSGTSVPRPA